MIKWKIQLLLGMTLIGQLSAQESSKKKEIKNSKNSPSNHLKENSSISHYVVECHLVYQPEDKTKKVSKMCLYDMLGNSLIEQKFSVEKSMNNYTINLQEIPAGTYHLKISFSDHTHILKEVKKK